MEGYLLKRSETFRRWNQRWFTLDPTTGRMEYRVQRGDTQPRGQILLVPESAICISPLNFHGDPEYDNCCFYLRTLRRKELYLAAKTPGAAQAWVATLRASVVVLKAHRDAVNAIGDTSRAWMQGSDAVAAAAAAASATASAAIKEVEAASQKIAIENARHMMARREMLVAVGRHGLMVPSVLPADRYWRTAAQERASSGRSSTLHEQPARVSNGVHMSAPSTDEVFAETLRVKDEALHQLTNDLRAREITIREMAKRLTETADAAEAAAAAAQKMDEDRRIGLARLEALEKETDAKLRMTDAVVNNAREREQSAVVAKETAFSARDAAMSEAALWRAEASRLVEKMNYLEQRLVAAEESAKRMAADAEEKKMAAESDRESIIGVMSGVAGEQSPLVSDVYSERMIPTHAIVSPQLLLDHQDFMASGIDRSEQNLEVEFPLEICSDHHGSEDLGSPGAPEMHSPVGICSPEMHSPVGICSEHLDSEAVGSPAGHYRQGDWDCHESEALPVGAQEMQSPVEICSGRPVGRHYHQGGWEESVYGYFGEVQAREAADVVRDGEVVTMARGAEHVVDDQATDLKHVTQCTPRASD